MRISRHAIAIIARGNSTIVKDVLDGVKDVVKEAIAAAQAPGKAQPTDVATEDYSKAQHIIEVGQLELSS